MNATLATSTDFYAGVNQPAVPSTMYLWAPLIVLGFGIVALAIVFAYLARADHRRHLSNSSHSFFDQ